MLKSSTINIFSFYLDYQLNKIIIIVDFFEIHILMFIQVQGRKGGWGGLSKTIIHHVWQTTNSFKITLAKASYNSPKEINFYQKINDSKPHIWSVPINFRFFGRNSQIQQKLTKKITYFTIQFHSKNPTLILRTSTYLTL